MAHAAVVGAIRDGPSVVPRLIGEGVRELLYAHRRSIVGWMGQKLTSRGDDASSWSGVMGVWQMVLSTLTFCSCV